MFCGRPGAKSCKILEENSVVHGAGREFLENYNGSDGSGPGLGLAGPSWAWLVLAGPGWAWLGLAGPGWAWLGLAGRGWAWLGLAGPGWA